MALGLAPVLLVGGGVAYVATRPEVAPPAPGPTTQIAPSAGSTLGLQIQPVQATGVIAPPRKVLAGAARRAGAVTAFRSTSPATSYGGSTVDPALRQKLDALEAAAEAAYAKANAAAKAAAAKQLNEELNLSPPLTGAEDWRTVASVVGGAAGAAVGAYVGGPLGAKVGALIGAYLGVKLADALAKEWDDLKDWLDSQWGTVTEAAEDAYDYVSGLLPF